MFWRQNPCRALARIVARLDHKLLHQIRDVWGWEQVDDGSHFQGCGRVPGDLAKTLISQSGNSASHSTWFFDPADWSALGWEKPVLVRVPLRKRFKVSQGSKQNA